MAINSEELFDSVSCYCCSDFVQSLNFASTDVEANVLRTLGSEFENCVTTLGSIQGWHYDQLQALYTLAKSV